MTAKRLLALTFAIIGLVLIGIYTHWLVCVGIFLLMWANNITNNDMLQNEINNVLKQYRRK